LKLNGSDQRRITAAQTEHIKKPDGFVCAADDILLGRLKGGGVTIESSKPLMAGGDTLEKSQLNC
jgi:hypothetical protein